MSVAYERKRGLLTRTEYEELVRRGVLEDARVELLYGRMVSTSPVGGAHVYGVAHLSKLLIQALGDRANVHVQAPFATPGESEPQPDVAVIPPGDYLDAPPNTAWLIVEVADSSLARDRCESGAVCGRRCHRVLDRESPGRGDRGPSGTGTEWLCAHDTSRARRGPHARRVRRRGGSRRGRAAAAVSALVLGIRGSCSLRSRRSMKLLDRVRRA
jgi:hypothetical protein